MEEKYLVEIFCEVSMDGLDKAVGEAFTKLAFEAVDKIIKVSFLLEETSVIMINKIKIDMSLELNLFNAIE